MMRFHAVALTALALGAGAAYLYSDICTGEVFAAVQSGGVITDSRDLGINGGTLVSFAEGPTGELYAIGLGGTIFQIVQA